MDSDTLQTASTYLNNLLLARGLLRNGKSLDFAKPTRDTRAQIINLVHDLLLRRDKEQESREDVALSLRTLRAEQSRRDGDIERLQARLTEKDRIMTQAQVEARSARAELKKLDLSTRGLHDQVARLKTTVVQVKAQCTTDLKKRNLQIERLKTHIQGQQRGNKTAVVAPSITISGGSGGSRGAPNFNASVRELQDPEYSLKQETNEFLTQLSQSLSDENDGLIAMIRGALHTLKGLLGLPDDASRAGDSTMGSLEGFEDSKASFTMSVAPVSYEALSAELQTTMSTLSTLLTSPNFVSMEEVEVRDDEIARLREGWEKMEVRWKEMLLMMDGWRRKMERTGHTVNLDDLRRGLGLGATFDDVHKAADSNGGMPLHEPALEHGGDISDCDSGLDGVDAERDPSPSRTFASMRATTSLDPPDFFDLRPVKGQRLRQLSQNVQSPRRQSPRKVAFVDYPEEEEQPQLENRPMELEEASFRKMQTPTILRAKPRSSETRARQPEIGGLDGTQSPKSRKRHSSPFAHLPERSVRARAQQVDLPSSSFLEDDVPQLTMQEKLQLAQVEAEQAMKSPARNMARDDEDVQSHLEKEDDLGKLRSPAKKTKIKGRPRRRKSTLSPEELESLLGLD